MSDIPQEEQMQRNMPHFKRNNLVAGAAMALATMVTATSAWAERGEGEGSGTILLQPLGGLQLKPDLLDYGSYNSTPPPVTNNRAGSSNRQPLRILIPPSFYQRQIKMYEKRMQNLEKVGMQNSEAYRSALTSHQRAIESYNRAQAAWDEDNDF